jgi:protein involved in polysaccharide export with SLBB domain
MGRVSELRFRAVFLGFITVVAGSACLDLRTPKPEVKPAVATSEAELLAVEQLGRGDILEVKVFREPDLNGVYPIGYDGAIVFPMIGKVKVVTRDVQQVADEIRDRLANGILVDPQVSVVLRERTAQKVHVLGEVKKEGTFAFRSGMSVIEAITLAGGFTNLAAPNNVKVTRVTGDEEHVFDVEAEKIGQGKAPNFALEPGDIVFVKQSIF